ncbi:hypothetical protein ADS79_13520 [Brevibacillus reuszeri]|uniref:Selenocysteine lyase n=1 Tax=Brevibacillus reuszeri TaxID=54915 RepID=A0A0K9YWP3_9BACL|nr:hypothetical protein ADS79_13520 [Brevibacillus reuszeri]
MKVIASVSERTNGVIILIWTYFDPKESILWGKRWMYKEEPELSKGAILYAKVASVIFIVILTAIFILN